VRRRVAATLDDARELVAADRVLVGGAVAENAGRQVEAGEAIELVGPPARFVSRGGEKLEAALARFGIDVEGRTALDAGASTGGFTDCLLQRGTALVVAVDVGHGQLHERVAADPRVRIRDRTNLRNLTPADVPGSPFAVVVADLAFISLRTVAGALAGLTAVDGDLVLLVKPQFEAAKAVVSKGKGIVREPAEWRSAVEGVVAAMAQAGTAMMGVMASPLRGTEGNVEFLLHLRKLVSGDAPSPDAVAARIEAAMGEGIELASGASA
jgi:23S rRNA (cytidine1920-2'-O)/16S rRNA (cytidine1409-2'-O)-methyltransferase